MMIRTLFALGLGCALSSGCSSNSSDPASAGSAAGSSGTGHCPDLSGAWQVDAHCEASLVGMSLEITQTGCTFSVSAPFDQFSGSVASDGAVSLSGPQSCTGQATTSEVTLSCTPAPCPVKLGR